MTPTPDRPALAAALAPIATESGSAALRRLSRDYYWFSPVLAEALADARADLIVAPQTEAEVLTALRVCHAQRVPVTPRGGGTGNYGQAMPLEGGVVLELSALRETALHAPGVVRAGGGARLQAIDTAMRAHGWQLRLYPSTWKTASVGGFVAGGATGCGALNFGMLDAPGNIVGLRLATMEAEPRVIELRGADLKKAIHAYGTTGILLSVDLALTPAVRWHERVVATTGFRAALALGDALGRATGLHLNQLAAIEASAGRYFRGLAEHIHDGDDLVIALVAESSVDAFDGFVAEHGGAVRFRRGPDDAPGGVPPVLEFCWNHTTLRAIVQDKRVTYLQCLFPTLDAVHALRERFGDELPMHVEFGRLGGDLALMGMPLLRYSTPERLREIIAAYRAAGCPVFDPHTYRLEGAVPGEADPVQSAFKLEADPQNLLNPGKMPGWPAAGSVPEGAR